MAMDFKEVFEDENKRRLTIFSKKAAENSASRNATEDAGVY